MASIKELEAKLFDDSKEEKEQLIASLRKDERKGVQQLVKKYETLKRKEAELEEMHVQMTKYERDLRQNGYQLLAGLDEVGRGPLAGPVVAAAVILPMSFRLLGLTDSKKLPKQKREEFAEIIKTEAIDYSIQMVHAGQIDEINIYEATKLAMVKAISTLTKTPDHLLVDALTLPIEISQTSIIKGDQLSVSIAASSILAKVARDEYMEKLDVTYPGFGFKSHVGYGTKEHLDAIGNLGITPEHRRSFRPIKEMVSLKM